MPYPIEVSRPAYKQIINLPAQAIEPLSRAIEHLERDPRPSGAVKLKGSDLWRIRVGDYRVVYAIDDGRKLVTVLRMGHRREVYR